jgi:hypothetical protein
VSLPLNVEVRIFPYLETVDATVITTWPPFFQSRLNSVGIDALYRNRVGVRQAGNPVILSVEFCVVADVRRISIAVSSVGIDLDSLFRQTRSSG